MKTVDQLKPTYAPVYAAALYPQLAAIFHAHGYALSVHGSLARDFDLIAVPWAETVSAPWPVIQELTTRFAIRLIGQGMRKPHGKTAFTLSIGHGECSIDLNFLPSAAPCEDASRNELAAIRLFLRLPDGESVMGFLRKLASGEAEPTFDTMEEMAAAWRVRSARLIASAEESQRITGTDLQTRVGSSVEPCPVPGCVRIAGHPSFATDEEIINYPCGNGGCDYSPRCETCRLVARVYADRATIEAHKALQAELVEALQCCLGELDAIKAYCVSEDAHDPDRENTLMQGDWFTDAATVALMASARAVLAKADSASREGGK